MTDIGYIMNVDNSYFNVIDIGDKTEPEQDVNNVIKEFIEKSFVNKESIASRNGNIPSNLTTTEEFIKKICPLKSGFASYYKQLGGGKSGARVYKIQYLD